MKRLWAFACLLVVSGGAASAQSIAFNQVATPFVNAQPLALGSGLVGTTQCGVFGDFNGDGFADYAAFSAPGSKGATTLRTYLGTAAGSPGAVRSTTLPNFACPTAQPIAADVNGDGRQDLLVLAPAAILVMLARADGSFTEAPSIAYTPIITTFEGSSGPAPSTLGNAVVGDLNGDGFADLIASDNVGQVLFFAGHGDGTFAAATVLAAAQTSTYQAFFGSLVAGDFNRDGLLDVAACAASSDSLCRGYLYLGSTTGTPVQAAAPVGEPIATADLNGDGNPDLLLLPTGDSLGGLMFAAGDGAGHFATPVNAGAGGQMLGVTGYAFLVDVNGDGAKDLVFEQRQGAAGLAWAAGVGDGTFLTPTVFGPGTGPVLEQAGLLARGKPALLDTAGTLYLPTTSANTYSASAWFVDFGVAPAGVTTPPVQISVAATAGDFFVSGVAASSPLAESDTCLDSPSQCAITLTLTPPSTAPFTGALTITGNGTPALISIPVFANEAAAAAVSGLRFSPGSITFAPQPVLVPSATQTVALTNAGTASSTLASIAITGNQAADFSETNTCGSSLAPEASCTVTLTYTPQQVGSSTATLSATDATGLSTTAALTGTAVYVPSLSASPAQLNFGNVRVGNTGAAQSVTLTNTGRQTTTLASASVTVSGDGSPSNFPLNTTGCAAALAPGATCVLTVAFVPPSAETVNGTLVLVDGNGKATDVGLTGTGYLSNANAVVTPTSLVFPQQVLGTTSAPQIITISNTGQQTLNISFIGISGPFTQTGDCATVAPGSSCTIAVTFTASVLGTVNGGVTVSDNSGLGTQTVALAGTGVPVPMPQLTVGPATVSFPDQTVGTISNSQTVTVSNTGNAPSQIQSVSVSGPFAVANGCGTIISSNASCSLAVVFAPTQPGPSTGALTIVDDAPGSPQIIPLGGNGLAVPTAQLRLSVPASFPDQLVNTTGAPQTITVLNTGNAPSQITSVTVTGAFAVVAGSDTCSGTMLAPGATCTAGVAFAPTVQGLSQGVLTLVDDAPGSPQTAALQGNGTTVSVTPTTGTTTTQTVSPGSPANYTLTLQPQDGFSGTLAVSCTGAPAGYQCTPSANSVALNTGAPVSVSFTVQSTATASATQPWPWSPGGKTRELPALAFPALWIASSRTRKSRYGAPPVPGQENPGGMAANESLHAAGENDPGAKRTRMIRSGWRGLLGALALAALLLPAGSLLSGCSGSGGAVNARITTETYTLMATFTAPSGATISEPLTLVVATTAP